MIFWYDRSRQSRRPLPVSIESPAVTVCKATAKWYEIEKTATSLDIGTVCYDSCDDEEEIQWKDKVANTELGKFMRGCMGPNSDRIQSLTISNYSRLDDHDMNAFIALLPRLPALRKLRFYDCNAPGTAQFLALIDAGAKHCPLLEEFCWDGWYDDGAPWSLNRRGLSDDSLLALAQYLKNSPTGRVWPGLKTLELKNCRFQCDEAHIDADGYHAIKACASSSKWHNLNIILDDMNDLEREAMDDWQAHESRGIDDSFD